jgi:hypothetical protein
MLSVAALEKEGQTRDSEMLLTDLVTFGHNVPHHRVEEQDNPPAEACIAEGDVVQWGCLLAACGESQLNS